MYTGSIFSPGPEQKTYRKRICLIINIFILYNILFNFLLIQLHVLNSLLNIIEEFIIGI